MTLPTNAPISLLQIQTEFGGPGNLLSYVAGGGHVTNGTQNGSGVVIPSSPPIDMFILLGSNASNVIARLYDTHTGTSGGPAHPFTETAPITGNVDIQIWGAGGAAGFFSSIGGAGGAGGGGGYSRTKVAVTAGQVFTCNVGAGGPGAFSGSSGNGQAAGTPSNVQSTITTFMNATGGGLGIGTGSGGSGGAGGVGSGGNIVNTNGAAGHFGATTSTTPGGKANAATGALATQFPAWGANNATTLIQPPFGGGGGDGGGISSGGLTVNAGHGADGAVYFIYTP